jgi:hypothetical protein
MLLAGAGRWLALACSEKSPATRGAGSVMPRLITLGANLKVIEADGAMNMALADRIDRCLIASLKPVHSDGASPGRYLQVLQSS